MNSRLKLSLISPFFFAALLTADNQQKNTARNGANMHNYLDEVFQNMENSMSQMRQAFANGMQNHMQGNQLMVEQKEKGLFLTIKDLETESVDATVNDEEDHLMIKTDQGTLSISVEDNFVSIHFNQQRKQERKNKNGKMETVSTMVGQQAYNMSLQNPLNLNSEQLKIDYDKESKTLTLEMPFKFLEEEQGRKMVPVNMKRNESKKDK